ncbi:Permease, cytosine/purine, uracil, thiamine, allantoin [Penicillium expansum]|uniref:Permease, cytosine/purine, uracil, thiamine, allantoin n=1 Tax=Penicillium expansum TaxID=27334 RepID=A0A0A2JR39_PENEN|nr:Permease, cytosine/purine, uracil, thiamine, allantoin [Penicillium expansum]KGO45802.1 Permease, cytosine/purine, uracil, thiamine, allantoin [Penicillium expansum]KGO54851.1 Permease, cytosine/purine, uracil, thiamine, allantoin [Penicillium expansum]KGO57907.1 Permease, cytosine/purine, uracil, thiamine, allantoin [Penicillium expansum]
MKMHINEAKARLSSLHAWKLPKEPSSLAPPGVPSSKDSDPIPPGLQTWNGLDFVNYWFSDLVNITSWTIGTAPLLVGLSTVDAILIVMLSGICNGLPTVLNGYVGSDYHIPFPIAVRSSFGYYFGNFPVFSRAVLSAVWFGVNSMTAWICVKAGDVQGIFNQSAKLSGKAHKWLWLATFSSTTNSWLTSAVNMSDYSRFAKTKSRGQWYQALAIPVIKTVYAVLGLAVVGAGRVLYEEDISSPVEMLPYWGHTGGGRLLAFLCAILWMVAQISCDISANSIPFGHDVMSFIPAWMTIRRGSLLCLLVGAWVMVPWLIVNSASKFLSFMSAYGVFISPICSIMIADYFLIRRRKLNLSDLYHPHGCYRYRGGINWRAFVTEFSFAGINLPGVVNNLAPSVVVPSGLAHLYQINWFVNTFGSFFVYWCLCTLWPPLDSLDTKILHDFVEIDAGGNGKLNLVSEKEAINDSRV